MLITPLCIKTNCPSCTPAATVSVSTKHRTTACIAAPFLEDLSPLQVLIKYSLSVMNSISLSLPVCCTPILVYIIIERQISLCAACRHEYAFTVVVPQQRVLCGTCALNKICIYPAFRDLASAATAAGPLLTAPYRYSQLAVCATFTDASCRRAYLKGPHLWISSCHRPAILIELEERKLAGRHTHTLRVLHE